MKIKNQLLLSYSIFVFMLLSLGIFSIYEASILNKNSQNIYHDRLVPTISLTKIVEKSGSIRLQMVQALQKKDSSMTEQALTDLKEIDEFIESYGKHKLTQEEEKVFADFKKDWGRFNQRVQINAALMIEGDYEKAAEGINLGGEIYKDAYGKLQTLIDINQEVSEDLLNDNHKRYEETKHSLLIIQVMAIMIAIVISFIFGKRIANPIKLVVNRVLRIAEGDLTGEKLSIKSRDEIAQLAEGINTMQTSLNTLVVQTVKTSEHVSASAEELSASVEQSTTATEQLATLSQNSSEGANIQLQSFSEVSSSIQQLSAAIQQIASSSSDMLHSSEKANESTMNGSRNVQNIVQQMSLISEIVGKLANIIQNLEQKSKEIGNITNIITNISEQTNLLALNAAIEAARAGEHGKGFAVVAGEVRKLAEESKKSALLIDDTLDKVQTEISNAVTYMNHGTEKVNQGIILSNEVSHSFDEIQALILSVTSRIQEVSASIQEMTSVSEHIATNSEQVKHIAETNALANQESAASVEEQLAIMEEISSSAQFLSSLAENLQTMLSKFKVK